MKTNMGEYLDNMINGEVVDMKNPNCINCTECCSLFTIIEEKEYKFLKKYLQKEGKELYKQGIQNWYEVGIRNNSLNCTCPFISKTKRCLIYSVRPRFCREFHCTEKLNRLNDKDKVAKEQHKTIFDLLPQNIKVDIANIFAQVIRKEE